MFFQKEVQTMSRSEIEADQLTKLKRLVKYCYDNSQFYHKRFDEIGLSPEDIKELKDIERIPFTTKADLRDNYPFGVFSVPQSKIVRLHASSGTTGKPTVVGYTAGDLDAWSDCMARIVTAAGADGSAAPALLVFRKYNTYTYIIYIYNFKWRRCLRLS